MNYALVTTVKRGVPVEDSGRLYLVDIRSRKVVHTCGMLPVKATISRNPRGGIRGLRGVCVVDNKAYVCSNDTITVLDYNLKPLYTIDSPYFSNLHDIKPFRKGFLVASCGNDSILYINSINEVTPIVCMGEQLRGDVNYNLTDRHGVIRPNSLCVVSDTQFFVICASINEYIKVFTAVVSPTLPDQL